VRAPHSVLVAVGRWLAVLVPAADLALVLSGLLDARTGLLVGFAFELLLVVVVVVELRVFRVAYRRGRVSGGTRGDQPSSGWRRRGRRRSSGSPEGRSASSAPSGGRFAAVGPSARAKRRCPTATGSR
jgi:hypothetical protein